VYVLVAGSVGALAASGAGTSASATATVGLIAGATMALVLALAPLVLFKPHARTLVIEPEGVRTTINGMTKDYAWMDILAVDGVGDRIVIQCANQNAFIVPPEAFGSSVERDEAFVTVRRYLQEGKSRETPQ